MTTKTRKTKDIFTRLLRSIKIDEQTDCWEWQKGKNNLGYGLIRDDKKMRTTHRVSYELHNNTTIPPDMCVCHTCDNPTCVNPQHLWLGTRSDNMKDMNLKGRGNRYSRLGSKNPRMICEYCNNDIASNIYKRFHGENCKHKTQE